MIERPPILEYKPAGPRGLRRKVVVSLVGGSVAISAAGAVWWLTPVTVIRNPGSIALPTTNWTKMPGGAATGPTTAPAQPGEGEQ